MNEPFVPMSKSAAAISNQADFRVTLVGEAENSRPFQPLGHGKTGSPCEPRVTMQRDGERISAIRIQCSCGQVIELACVYENGK